MRKTTALGTSVLILSLFVGLLLLPGFALSQQDSAGSTSAQSPPQARQAPTILDSVLTTKFAAIAILGLLGFALLLGRSVSVPIRVGALLVAFVLFGLDLLFPLHPSPMCASTKLFMFRFTMGRWMPAFLALFGIIVVLSLVARKLFCGWVCPLGAVQELINRIPFKWRRKKFSFVAFNSLRMGLLVLFFLTFFAVRDQVGALAEQNGASLDERLWGAFSSYSVYGPLNMFELLHWHIDTLFIIMSTVLVVASLALYRPFCYAICPIGAISWLLEYVTPGRVRVNQTTCTDCGDCSEASPCPTIDKLVDGRKIVPDCTSCGICIRACPEKAISLSWSRPD
jgi:polyferredoxin